MEILKYEDIERVNKEMHSIQVKDKPYVTVPERVKAFRKLFPDGRIDTDILSLENGTVTMKCTIFAGDKILSTGLAQEKESSSFINKTSFIENAETSAVGRALGMLGLGIDASIASAEELVTAMANQGQPDRYNRAKSRDSGKDRITVKKKIINDLCKPHNLDPVMICSMNGCDWDEITETQAEALIASLKKKFGDVA